MKEFKIINDHNISVLESFILSLQNEKINFRYYDSRPISTCKNHLLTCLLMIKGMPVGYGHLDKENKDLWLGVVVLERYQGCGYGREIMNFLISYAREHHEKSISLTVDLSNHKAAELYRNLGFIFVKRIKENVNKLELTI